MLFFLNFFWLILAKEVYRLLENLSFFSPGVDENGKSHRYEFYDDHVVITYSSDRTFARLCYLNGPSKGGMISRNAFLGSEFRIDIRFYLVRPDKNSYGDGMAFWVTKENEYISGDCYGRSSNFTGCLVVLNTSKTSKINGVEAPYIGVACGNNLQFDSNTDGSNIIKSPIHLQPEIFNSKCILRLENLNNILKVSISYKDNGFQEIYKISNSGIPSGCKFGISASNSTNNFEYRIMGIRSYQIDKITAHSAASVESIETKKSSKFIWFIFIVAIAGLGYYLYRRGERLSKD